METDDRDPVRIAIEEGLLDPATARQYVPWECGACGADMPIPYRCWECGWIAGGKDSSGRSTR